MSRSARATCGKISWEFAPTHKLALVTNHLPRIRGTDHGIWRRIRRVPFVKKFWNPDLGETGPPELKQDPTLGDALVQEYPGILTWIVRGTLAWYHDGEQAPKVVMGSTEEYRAQQDLVGTFMEECCTTAIPTAVCGATDLYKAYKTWAEENGEFCMPQRQFGMAMSERGFNKKKN